MSRARFNIVLSVCLALITTTNASAIEPERTFVIIHRAPLAQAAEAWGEYRRETGWIVDTRLLPDAATGDAAREWIQRAIREAHARSGAIDPSEFAVLLLGDAEGDAGIPTWKREQTDESIRSHRDPEYATDHPYQLVDDDDHMPDVPLGRIPVSNADDALIVLNKIKRFEAEGQSLPAPHRLSFVAGEGRFGPLDRLLEWMFHRMVDEMVPIEYDLRVAYAHPTSVYCPPPEDVTNVALQSIAEESAFFNYVGHGGPTGLDQLTWSGGETNILRVPDLDALPSPSRQPGPAMLTCCSTGWFDLGENRRSLAEAMLLHPDGPVAVIAGSRPTHPYANALQQKNFVREMLERPAVTIGLADLNAALALMDRDALDRQIDAIAAPLARLMRWPTSLASHRGMHMELYNLLGDPAMALPKPRGQLSDLAINDGAIEATIPGLASGTVTVLIESARDSFTDPDAMHPPTTRGDAQFIEKTRHNYPRSQQRVLWRADTKLDGDRLTIALPRPLPAGATILRIVIVGRDGNGELLDAFTGVSLQPKLIPAKRTTADQ